MATEAGVNRSGDDGGRPDPGRSPGPGGEAHQLADEAERAGEQATGSRTFGVLVTVGLIVYGGVHLVVAWIFLQVAWASGSAGASGNGPVTAMSRNLLGQVLLWTATVGMGALVVWRLAEAAFRRADGNRGSRIVAKLVAVFEAVIYAVIAISAAQAALTGGRQGSVTGEGNSERSLGGMLMAHGWGRALIIVIAVILLALGVELFRSAITRSYAEELDDEVSRPVVLAGGIGTFVKGVVLSIISGMLVWAVVSYDPSKTGGLDSALRTVRSQPYGPALLTLIGGGLALYGFYCFAWSRHAKH